MFHFENGNSLCFGRRKVLTGLAPWLNIVWRPWDKGNPSERLPLVLKEASDTVLSFEDEGGAARLTLSLKEDGPRFALFAAVSFDPTGKMGYGTHIDPLKGLGIAFDFPHKGNFVDAFMRCLFWQAAFVTDKSKNVKPRTQVILARGTKDALCLMPAADKLAKTEIFPEEKACALITHTSDITDSFDECVLVGAIDSDVYALTESCASYGLSVMNKPGKLRRDKKYPEVFEYLGWCSWDAFHMEVTEQDLLDKAKEFKDKEIPVRWMILDDMWGDVTGNERKTMHARELNDWEAAPDRFPHGLKGAVSRIKEQYGLSVGIWHPTSGYWAGLNPNGALAKRLPELLEYTVPGFMPDEPRLLHSFDKKKVEKYYDLQHAFYKDCGIDFTKVDNQGSTERFCYLKGGVSRCAANLHSAIEKAARKYYGGALINCMGMPNENFWNRTYSSVNRFSGDFQPENRQWFVQHLLQCSYNSLTQGSVFTGDWDMWWSDDDQAKKNAVLRAMSGGPIYMSDELGRSIRSVIMPTVFSSGRILRLKDPARPTEDCLFEDNEHSGKPYKVFNRCGDCGILAAFNLDSEEKPVSGTASACDVRGLKQGEYAVYDWFAGTATKLSGDEAISMTLNNYDDFRLLIFVPVKEGKAVIGLKEKYMTPATVTKKGKTVTALDGGTLLVYAEKNPGGWKKMGENLYGKKTEKDETVTL